jgi:hypothetical protein
MGLPKYKTIGAARQVACDCGLSIKETKKIQNKKQFRGCGRILSILFY